MAAIANPHATEKRIPICCISLHKADRIRLIEVPAEVIAAILKTIRYCWPQGIREEKTYAGSHEIRLKGGPWDAYKGGVDAINSRTMIMGIIRCLLRKGWTYLTGADLSLAAADKDTLFFEYTGNPVDVSLFTISCHDIDKVRTLDMPLHLVSTLRHCIITSWPRGIQKEKTYLNSHQFKLYGHPFSAEGEDTVHVRQLMINILSHLRGNGHQLVKQGLVGAIGNTPLIRLNRLSRETGSEILAKAEWMNPGGSVKDRAALYVIKNAEEQGLIRPGGTIVEGTAGNTGIGLAHVCRAKGYKCVIYMPNTQSQEKIDLLRMLGAEVYPVPAVAFDNPDNYNHQAKRHAEKLENAVWTNQFDNVANRRAHIETTGPEIWEQTEGKVDGFTCATGTAGTLAGVARFLKEQNKDIKIFLADPPGSVLYSYFKSGGKLTERTGSSITEGIGQGRVTENLKPDVGLVDDALHIPDEESIKMVYRLLDEEGIYVGASSALNAVAAVEMAKRLGKGKTIVTILCDGAYRYQTRLFSRKWLESKSLVDAIPDHLQKYIVLP